MIKDRVRQPSHIGVGTSSIIAVFVVLCLTALSVLSLTSARNNLNITRLYEKYTEGYYEADAEAQAFIARKRAEAVEGVYSEVFPYCGGMRINLTVEISEGGEYNIKEYKTSDTEQDITFK